MAQHMFESKAQALIWRQIIPKVDPVHCIQYPDRPSAVRKSHLKHFFGISAAFESNLAEKIIKMISFSCFLLIFNKKYDKIYSGEAILPIGNCILYTKYCIQAALRPF